jgi:hypothetical protein
MIKIYTGLPRHGKTLNMVYDLVRMMRYGRRVITNTPIWCWVHGRKVYAEFYDDPDEFKFYFLTAHNCILVCDESSVYFSSLKWNKLGEDFFIRFRQAGKTTADLYCTSQDWTDTVASLRKVVEQTTVCRKRHFLGIPPIDLRFDHFNKKTQFYDRWGVRITLPMVYHMKTVTKGYFKTTAMRNKTLNMYVLGQRNLYPSQFRYASACYQHDYQIKDSATLRSLKLPEGLSFKEYKDLTHKHSSGNLVGSPDHTNLPGTGAGSDGRGSIVPALTA